MRITYLMVATYIFDCVLIGTKPCKYFQLNALTFNAEAGIFSKLDIDRLIPEKWRLQQSLLDDTTVPEAYPVFIKPEWGQNSSGIIRVDDPQSLDEVRRRVSTSPIKYLLQEASPEQQEYEIFSIQHHQDEQQFAEFTITRVENPTGPYPVNGIYNTDTIYRDITDQFTADDKQRLWQLMCEAGRFGISRVGLRADSTENLLAGKFHVIEINLYLPMPINMLDPRYGFFALWRFVRRYMMSLARLTKARDKTLKEKPVFTKMMLYNRSSAVLNYIRDRI
jgi:hypothetical protein